VRSEFMGECAGIDGCSVSMRYHDVPMGMDIKIISCVR
jgi:hypothetical protein